MDDFKLYAKNEDHLENLQNIVKRFSDDVGMQLDLDKCAKVTFGKANLQSLKTSLSI